MVRGLDKVLPREAGRYNISFKFKSEGENDFISENRIFYLKEGEFLSNVVADYVRRDKPDFTFLHLVSVDKLVDVNVKCSYEKGLFSDTYFIKFKGSELSYPLTKGEVFVSDSAFVKLSDSQGFVKGTLMKKNDLESIVVIRDSEQGGVFSTIPNTEIDFN